MGTRNPSLASPKQNTAEGVEFPAQGLACLEPYTQEVAAPLGQPGGVGVLGAVFCFVAGAS